MDIIKTKRWWILTMQMLISAAFVLLAFSLPSVSAQTIAAEASEVSLFNMTLLLFWIAAFASATHDIAADGFYMLALDQDQQSFFVGIRSTFYRLSSIFGQGVLVVLAGVLEMRMGNIPRAWSITLMVAAAIFAIVNISHNFTLPRPKEDVGADKNGESLSALDLAKEFVRTFKTFFQKKDLLLALAFMLLYRLPEAFLVKMMNPFLLDGVADGGLGLTTQSVGLIYGTIGVGALTVGGILGGIAAARWGLKKSMWPMSLALALPCLSFVFLSIFQPQSLWVTGACVAFDQFGYGFGFTAYMLYLMRFSDGEFKTAHYSLCTAFMAMSMMLPGMVAGYICEGLGYTGFFIFVMICCIFTILVTARVRRSLK